MGKTFFRMGFSLYATKDYMSRIRGGHNFMQIRVGEGPLYGPDDRGDILVALNRETVERHLERIRKGGVILFAGQICVADRRTLEIDAQGIAAAIGNNRVANTVYAGALLKILGLTTGVTREILSEHFSGDVLAMNREALEKGFERAGQIYDLQPVEEPDTEQIYVSGNEALAMGALAAGVRFYAAYPMTPSTGILNFLAGRQEEFDVVVEQAEDEIAAINMALGASYGGVRAMTGTSGGGFALMNEGLGLAGITEIPVVIANVQRPGPATGLPTRTEQGDLLFVINSAPGDFPLLVIAPRDAQEAFYQTFRAFNLADRYQIPVVILSDQFLADSARNVPAFEMDGRTIDRGRMASGSDEGEPDRRYLLTEDGISPRMVPGALEGEIVLVDSDEHDEWGHIIEGAKMRVDMVDKRARKVEKLIHCDLQEPRYIGEEAIELLLVGWGSTFGPLREAQETLHAEGVKVGLLSFGDVWPLPVKELKERVKGGVELCVVENNSTGQFARLLASETGIQADHRVLKYDGRPFSGRELASRVKKEVLRQ